MFLIPALCGSTEQISHGMRSAIKKWQWLELLGSKWHTLFSKLIYVNGKIKNIFSEQNSQYYNRYTFVIVYIWWFINLKLIPHLIEQCSSLQEPSTSRRNFSHAHTSINGRWTISNVDVETWTDNNLKRKINKLLIIALKNK